MTKAIDKTALRSLADRNLPRYTSYPTAPHFSEEVDGEVYGQWLSQLDPAAPASLYLHVPYCQQLCWYCGCNTRVEQQPKRLSAYARLLSRELDLVSRRLKGRPLLTHLHWGGGTPTVLPPEDFARVMTEVRERFILSPKAELAVEIDPRGLSAGMLEALIAGGINRASLGVQTFDEGVQEAINRVQPYEQVAAVVRQLRAVGIAGINFDLLYGLPYQSVAEVERTVEAAVALAPDRLAVFGYAHVPWMKSHQRLIDEAALPDSDERLAQADAVRRKLTAAGYVAIGIDHFARPDDPLAEAFRAGTLRRNFQGYTTDPADSLIALGASAIGRLPQGFVQNDADLPRYAKAIEAGGFATARGLAFSDEDRLRGAAIERAMCATHLDLEALCQARGAAPNGLDGALDGLLDLERLGLVTRKGRRIEILPEADPFRRHLAACFDAHLGKGEARHSKAV